MSEFNIEVAGGKSVRLPTAGKYCDRDILVTATGDGGDTDAAYQEGVADGIEQGKKEFWLSYQDGGERTNYLKAFANLYWNDDIFRPLFDIKADNMQMTFNNCGITDLKTLLEDLGIVLDTSNATSFLQCFQSSSITHVPTIDMHRATGNNGYAFGSGSLVEIEKIICSASTAFISTTFNGCANLVNVKFEGSIAQSISLSACSKLSIASAVSLLKCLHNYKGTSSEYSKTVTLHAATWALLESAGSTAPGGVTWREYVQYTLCWNM